MSDTLAYFLTWTTYGTWLPGDSRGWVNRKRRHGEYIEPPCPALEEHAGRLLKEPPVLLDPEMRAAVDRVIRETCDKFDFYLHALNVRTNHVHVVVTAPNESTGKLMGILKVRGTRILNAMMTPNKKRKRWWTRSGSKRVLNSEESLHVAIHYVMNHDAPCD